MKNSNLTKPHYIDSLRWEKKLWLRWHERLHRMTAHLAEFIAVLSLDSALEVYAAKSLYSKFGHCDCFDSSMAAKPGSWLGATGLWMHTLIVRQALGQTDAMQRPGAKTELGPHMGLGVASYANVIKGVFV
jgi:hypothetical protein